MITSGKKAVVGNFMATFVATIIIVAILLGFILFSGLIKSRIANTEVKQELLDKEGTPGYIKQIQGYYAYSLTFKELIKLKLFIEKKGIYTGLDEWYDK